MAFLAGIGITWYTWLEQARDVKPSARVLEGLAKALRLGPAEKAYLFGLARPDLASPSSSRGEEVGPALRRLVEGMERNPAYVTNRRWDVLAWNRAATTLFGDFDDVPPKRRNVLWYLFCNPAWRETFRDWEGVTEDVLGQFRQSSGRYPNDPGFAELTEALAKASPEFRSRWERHEVTGQNERRKELEDPRVGRMAFEYVTMLIEDAPELRLTVYAPSPDSDTADKLAELLKAGRAP